MCGRKSREVMLIGDYRCIDVPGCRKRKDLLEQMSVELDRKIQEAFLFGREK